MSDEGKNVYTPFPGDSYDTPENVKRSVADYLCLGTRASFYIRNFYVFVKSGKAAQKGLLDQDLQIRNSLENVRITESCGGKFHLRGLNNIDLEPRPAVIVANHMSLLETTVMHSFLRPKKDFCFVIKQQLFDVPYFGHIMRSMHCIGIGRQNPRDDFKAVLEEGAERLKAGQSVIIFPQGSRSEVFRKAHFNTIGVKLARAAKAPLIPLAIRTDFLCNGKYLKDLGPLCRKNPIWFEFGKPIPEIRGTGKEEQQQIIDFITSRLESWGCKVE